MKRELPYACSLVKKTNILVWKCRLLIETNQLSAITVGKKWLENISRHKKSRKKGILFSPGCPKFAAETEEKLNYHKVKKHGKNLSIISSHAVSVSSTFTSSTHFACIKRLFTRSRNRPPNPFPSKLTLTQSWAITQIKNFGTNSTV